MAENAIEATPTIGIYEAMSTLRAVRRLRPDPIPDAVLRCSKNNPLCGDEITVFVHEDDGKVLDVSFLGQGCSISQSSASMMTEAAAGKTRGEVEQRIGAFRGMMAGEVEPDEQEFGDLIDRI